MAILSPDEISTIFVVGFPPDIKDREFQNLFMFASGFEGASLKVPEASMSDNGCSSSDRRSDDEASITDSQVPSAGIQCRQLPSFKQQIIGFARFQRRQDALAARDHLNGRCMDSERSCVLKVEMAKKNLFIAPRKQSVQVFAANRDDASENLSYSEEMAAPIIKTTRSLSLSIPGNPAPIDISLPNALYTKTCEGKASFVDSLKQPTFVNNASSRSFSLTGSAAGNSPPMYVLGENPPCNTLYVGNLPLNADEEELRMLFSPCEGYRRLSYKNKPNGPMCFVEFDDIACARKAMDAFYGTLLSSSTKGGIRLSFSKNPLGVRSSTPGEFKSARRSEAMLAEELCHQQQYYFEPSPQRLERATSYVGPQFYSKFI